MLSALLVALAVAAPPAVWVVERESGDPRCTGEALAQAIRMLRPGAEVRVGASLDAKDLQVALLESPTGFSLSVSGGAAPFTRELPEKEGQQCGEAVNLSALIVSRDIDALPGQGSTPPLTEAEAKGPSPARAPTTAFVTDVGFVASQIAGGISPGFTLDLGLRAGAFFAWLGGDLLLAQHPPIDFPGATGTYVVQSDPLRAMAGVSLQLGPGTGLLGAGGGALLTSVSVRSTSFPQTSSSFSAEPFVALSAGYSLPLPDRFFVSLRYEERWVPSPTKFYIFGTSSSVDTSSGIQTPTFSGALSLLVGREFL